MQVVKKKEYIECKEVIFSSEEGKELSGEVEAKKEAERSRKKQKERKFFLPAVKTNLSDG